MLDILYIVGKHRYQRRGFILDHLGLFVIDIHRSILCKFPRVIWFL